MLKEGAREHPVAARTDAVHAAIAAVRKLPIFAGIFVFMSWALGIEEIACLVGQSGQPG